MSFHIVVGPLTSTDNGNYREFTFQDNDEFLNEDVMNNYSDCEIALLGGKVPPNVKYIYLPQVITGIIIPTYRHGTKPKIGSELIAILHQPGHLNISQPKYFDICDKIYQLSKSTFNIIFKDENGEEVESNDFCLEFHLRECL